MISISFDFDEITQKVTNVVVTSSEGKVVKKRQAKKSKPSDGRPIVEVDANKLILSDAVVELLDAESGESRIAIQYHQVNNQETFPLIGKSEMFADKLAGNKLTKSNTVSFKGQQRTFLVQYGELFTLEKFDDGVYKLIPIESVDEVITAVQDVKEELVTEETELKELDNEINNEIQMFNDIIEDDDVDELPF